MADEDVKAELERLRAENERLKNRTARSYSGVGLTVEPARAGLLVTSAIKGPAQAAGVRPGDIIVRIDGRPAGKLTFDQSINLIKGEKGTVVHLTVHRLHQGRIRFIVVRQEVACYVASGRRDTTPEEEIRHLRKLLEESGARAVKFRVGGRMSRNADASLGRTEKLIPLVRKTFGDTIDIHADANSSYDPPQAIRVGRMLEEVGAVYFEEPCPFDHLEDT